MFYDDDETCTIYLMHWKDIDLDKEFRAFVYQNEITAISNQNLYSPNKWLMGLTESEIKNIIYLMLQHFEINIKDKIRFIESYTMDLALIDNVVYFIEPNGFGKYYSAGSSLFQWVNDHEKLHDCNSIEFRFTVK